jgi:hypothetical protein
MKSILLEINVKGAVLINDNIYINTIFSSSIVVNYNK